MEGRQKPGVELPKQRDRKVATGQGSFGVTSDQLLGEARELWILHAGRQYRLHLTKNGKLILTA